MINTNKYKRRLRRVPELKFPIKLDIGCGEKRHSIDGKRKTNEFTGIDIVDYGQDIVWDIEDGLPLPDNSCEEIHCSHVLEHLEDTVAIVNEMWRVLKPDGEAHIIVPSIDHEAAYMPVHIRYFDEGTFQYFAEDRGDSDKSYETKRWEIIELVNNHRNDLHCKMKPYEGKNGKTKKVG